MRDAAAGFVFGWGACTLFYTAIAAFWPHWLGLPRRRENK